MKKQSFLAKHTFKEYLRFLRDTMGFLEEYRAKTGNYRNLIKDVRDGLEHADPFVTYKASIAATMLLADNSLYH